MSVSYTSRRRSPPPLPPPRRLLLSLFLASSAAVVVVASSTARPLASVPSSRCGASGGRRAVERSRASRRWGEGPVVAVVDAAAAAAPLSVPRGGALSDGYDSDYDDDDDDFDDFDDLDDAFGDADMDMIAEDDFGEDGLVERIVSAWGKTPPFTKAYLTASAAATASGYVVNRNEFPKVLLMEWRPILTRLQIWRPFTAFLNVGPFGLGYLMTGHFVWTYMSTLERLNHDRPYDFWLMILFGCTTMVAGYTFLNISPKFLGHNLSTFLVYVWSRYHEGMEVNMFELFNTRAEMLPWFFLAQTFLLEGEFPVLDLLGILFGHIYHHCKTSGMLRAPKFVVDWYEDGDDRYSRAVRRKYKSISSDFEMQ